MGAAKRHFAGPLSYDVFREIGSLQLHAPFDEKEWELAESRSENHNVSRREQQLATRLRQSLNVFVGVSVGLAATVVRIGCEVLGSWRREQLLMATESDGVFGAVLIGIALTATCSLLATCCVILSPASSGSGIPAVLAFLNGCDVRASFGVPVFFSKIAGTVCAVGGGMILGPEGPMVHIGAMVGMMVVERCVIPTLRLLKADRLEAELRRQPMRFAIQAAVMGAGAGIAAAFNAPLSGTVFVVEEAASFFSKRLLLHSFVTCVFAVATANLVGTALGYQPVSVYTRTAGCSATFSWSCLLVVNVAIVGSICGLLAIGFNHLLVRLTAIHARYAQRHNDKKRFRARQLGFAVVVAAMSASFAVLLAVSSCRPSTLQNAFQGSSGCIPEDWLQQLVEGSKSVDSGTISAPFSPSSNRTQAFIPSPGLFGAIYDPVRCPLAVALESKCRVPGLEAHFPNDSKALRPEFYCCGFSDLLALQHGNFFSLTSPVAPLDMKSDAWPRSSCPSKSFDHDNKIWIDHYSPGAALTLVEPTVALRNLLTRGSPGIFPLQMLAWFLLGSMFLAILSAAAWMPGGLLVPMMAIGAAAGRMYGLTWHEVLGGDIGPQYALPWIPELQPLLSFLYPGRQNLHFFSSEPGIMALSGCAAFLSGSGSLVMFVLVLLLEVTLEPCLIPVILISVLSARCMASLLRTTGLYHELMNVQSLPFLSESGHWRQGHYTVQDLLLEDGRRERGFESGSTFQLDSAPSLTNLTQLAQRTTADSGNAISTDQTAETCNQTANHDVPPLTLLKINKTATLSDVREVLDTCLPGDFKPTVHGFPVVDHRGQLCGLVTREALESLLQKNFVQSGGSSASTVPIISCGPLPNELTTVAGVEHVMDRAPFVLQASTPVLHAYMLFTRCGVRHVVVVSTQNKPIGVLTRKSLMPWRTPWHEQELLHHDTFLEQRTASASPPNSPPQSRLASRHWTLTSDG